MQNVQFKSNSFSFELFHQTKKHTVNDKVIFRQISWTKYFWILTFSWKSIYILPKFRIFDWDLIDGLVTTYEPVRQTSGPWLHFSRITHFAINICETVPILGTSFYFLSVSFERIYESLTYKKGILTARSHVSDANSCAWFNVLRRSGSRMFRTDT